MELNPDMTAGERERVRLAALSASGLHRGLAATTKVPGMLDDVAVLASRIIGTPTALVTVLDEDEQWFLGRAGFDARATPVEDAFCAHALSTPDELTVVRDATVDERFRENPLVTGEPHIRFYAGMPVRLRSGQAVGTVCAIDYRARDIGDDEADSLRRLAQLVEHKLASVELTLKLDQAHRNTARRADEEHRFLTVVLENLSDAIVACDQDGRLTVFNEATRRAHGLPAEPLPPEEWADHYNLYASDGVTPLETAEIPLIRALKGLAVVDEEIIIAPPSLPRRVMRCTGQQLRAADGEVLGAVVAMTDVTSAVAAQARLEYMATHDQLTGLLNRSHLSTGVADMLSDSRANRVAVAYLDLNQFKRTNDVLGHQAGDAALRTVAERLRAALPVDAALVRMGGDEFLAVWPAPGDADDAQLKADLKRAVEGEVSVEGVRVPISCAVGVVVHKAEPVDLRRWIERADQVMYADKRTTARSVRSELRDALP